LAYFLGEIRFAKRELARLRVGSRKASDPGAMSVAPLGRDDDEVAVCSPRA